MRLPAAARALPSMLRVGFADAVAYRAELIVWVLSTTMPLIMLALWSAVAREAPMGRYGQREFTAYFLVTFIVRQLVGSWISWQLNWEIRQGTLSLRLLRPIHPLYAYAVESLGVLPLRTVVCLPMAAIALWFVGTDPLPDGVAGWTLAAAALVGSWLLAFLASFALGTLAFYFDSSLKVAEVWLALFFVFSGYMAPIELYPGPLRVIADWLPFRYLMGLPVELLTSAHDPGTALGLLARQWAWVALAATLGLWSWRGGLRRFAAYGG